MKVSTWIILLAFLLPSEAIAGTLESGNTAFDNHDYPHAVTLLQPLANDGNPVAQYELGLMYENGWGVKQNYAEAMNWLRKSADKGFSWAQYHIGYIYDNGLGVPVDHAKANEWWDKSHAPGNNMAQYKDRAVMPPPANYVPPDGVIPDQATAVQVGVAILKPIFGEEQIKREGPFSASLTNNVWTVVGHLPLHAVGGTAEIELSKSKGCVLRINHSQ